MCNQCIEQCAIYTFLSVGPTWDGLFGPIFCFWWFLDPMVWREITRRSFEGWRCSRFGHEDLHGWVLFICLYHL